MGQDARLLANTRKPSKKSQRGKQLNRGYETYTFRLDCPRPFFEGRSGGRKLHEKQFHTTHLFATDISAARVFLATS